MAHNYDIGTKAWQPDATEGWVASEVTSKSAEGDKVILIFTLANGEVRIQTPIIISIPLILFSKLTFLSTDQEGRDY